MDEQADLFTAADADDTSVTTHAGLRVVEFGGKRFVGEVKVSDGQFHRSVTVLCAPGLGRIADSLAWRVGEELGFTMHGGGSRSFGTGHVDTCSTETGNGRYCVTVCAYPATKPAPARRRAPHVYAIVGGRVDVRLESRSTSDDVFWSERCNSYVLVAARADDRDAFKLGNKHVTVTSVNGAGEIRWTVQPYQIEYALADEAKGRKLVGDVVEQIAAARHFGVVAPRAGETAQPCFGGGA